MTRLMLTVAALTGRGIGGDGRFRSAKRGEPEPIILKADQSIFRLAWGPDGKKIAVVGVGFDKRERIQVHARFWDAEKREVRRSARRGEHDSSRIDRFLS